MRYIKHDIGYFHSSEDVLSAVSRLCALIKDYPFILKPVRGIDDGVKKACSERGFLLYSTVRKTTLLYDRESDCFLKILHPLNLKARVSFLFTNRAENIYRLSERLIAEGLKIAKVIAYGTLKRSRMPFYAMRRVDGRSLYDLLIRERKPLKTDLCKKVMDEVARLHALGYWFSDAHLSHIFINDEGVSGLIDVDSIRKNSPFNIRNIAKDLAGLNYPGLPLTEDEKMALVNHYMSRLNIIVDKERFLKLLTSYTERRWRKVMNRGIE
jgi:tRNA A-37 threonylcarbamoyl transferase component Bud32